jgi:hypothetical protein
VSAAAPPYLGWERDIDSALGHVVISAGQWAFACSATRKRAALSGRITCGLRCPPDSRAHEWGAAPLPNSCTAITGCAG